MGTRSYISQISNEYADDYFSAIIKLNDIYKSTGTIDQDIAEDLYETYRTKITRIYQICNEFTYRALEDLKFYDDGDTAKYYFNKQHFSEYFSYLKCIVIAYSSQEKSRLDHIATLLNEKSQLNSDEKYVINSYLSSMSMNSDRFDLLYFDLEDEKRKFPYTIGTNFKSDLSNIKKLYHELDFENFKYFVEVG